MKHRRGEEARRWEIRHLPAGVMLKFLIVIGLVILAANALVVLMVGVVMLVDWVRERQRVQRDP